MKQLNYSLILILVLNAVSCGSNQKLKLPIEEEGIEKRINDRFTGFGFDRFR